MPPRTLLHIFPTFNVGGVQSRFVQLANHFSGRYRHRIVSMDGGIGAMERLDPKLDAAIVPVSFEKGRTLHNVLIFRRVLKAMRPNLLVTSNWGSIEWGMANIDHLIPHMHMEDGFGPEEANRQIPRRMLTRRLVLSRSLVMLPSQTLMNLALNVWKLPRRACLYLPNGVDCTRFNVFPDEALATQFGIARDRPVIGTVGVLRAEKNFLRLLEAFAVVRKARAAQLVIVGGGGLLDTLKSQAQALGVTPDVVFTGASSVPERLLPLFSIFALSSDTEQMPMSILEAMAAGRPIATTDVGDVRNMIAEENRAFAVTRDATRLGEAILGLIADPAGAASIGRANRERALSVYDQERMFAGYRRLFDGDLRNDS